MISRLYASSILITYLLCGCASQTDSIPVTGDHQKLSQKIGEWENIHEGSEKLAGVIVNQYPDNAGAPNWEHKHPRMIMYFMWDGTIHETHHFPDGSRISDQEHRGKLSKNFEHLWHDVDFSHGSDPQFDNHEDPRLRIKNPEQDIVPNP